MAVQAAHSQQVYRVDGVSGNDGNAGFPTWSDALQTIQEAIDRASADDEVWVKTGIYTLASAGSTIMLADRVNVHGGFAGTETLRTQADPYANPTTITGNLNGGGNAYHVVTATNIGTELTRFDGFVIEGGDANSDSENRGGGLIVVGTEESTYTLNVSRCWFDNNEANRGGAAAIRRTATGINVNVEFTNCEFTGNTAANGGAIWLSGTAVTITNSLFVGNEATGNGGALHVAQTCGTMTGCGFYNCTDLPQSTALMQNCTVTQNIAGVFGGGAYVRRGAKLLTGLEVVSSIFWGNMTDDEEDTEENEQIAEDFYCDDTVDVTYFCVQELDIYANTGNIDDNPLFVNSYHLNSGSPCVDTGAIGPDFPQDVLDFNHDTDVNELAPDLDRFTRIIRDDIDMGCYERLCVCLADIVDHSTFLPPPDGVVTGADLAYLLVAWGPGPSIADIVDSATFQPPPDGEVDGADLGYMLASWGECANPKTCEVAEMFFGGDPNPLEDEMLGPLLEELLETGDAELAETIAALLQEMMGE